MNFTDFKTRFTAAINKLALPQNDKYALLEILKYLNSKDESIDNKPSVTTRSKSPSTGEQSKSNSVIVWDNNEKYDEDVRVRTTALKADGNVKVGDTVIDNNKVKRRIVSLESNDKVAVLTKI